MRAAATISTRPRVLARRGSLTGGALVAFLALTHTATDALTSMVGAKILRGERSPTAPGW